MITAKAGMQGATPTVAVKPVDPSLPQCPKLAQVSKRDEEHLVVLTYARCTRRQGHYGPCGVAK